ncbi:P-loop containing nucleoside triphosphate hydrolase protein [Penicillium malachiteum]|nr:P-loop containing nucleoside triphosphate hydrolase protein [Penicillium malachiteum]
MTIYISYYNKAYDILVDWISKQPFIQNTHSLITHIRSTQRSGNIFSTKKKPYKGYLLILHYAIKEHQEDLRISTISLNTNILKALVEECCEKYLKDTQQKISIFKHHEGEWKKARLRSI